MEYSDEKEVVPDSLKARTKFLLPPLHTSSSSNQYSDKEASSTPTASDKILFTPVGDDAPQVDDRRHATLEVDKRITAAKNPSTGASTSVLCGLSPRKAFWLLGICALIVVGVVVAVSVTLTSRKNTEESVLQTQIAQQS
jgi:hypothetical protein